MTVTTTNRVVHYLGNGIATEFDYTFPIPDTDSVVVFLEDTDTGETVSVASGDYMIEGTGPDSDGGSVIYPLTGLPISSDYRIYIMRVTKLLQEVTVSNQTRYYANIAEAVWDRLMMGLQDISEELDRTLRVAVGNVGFVMQGGSLGANKLVSTDANGEFILQYDIDELTASISSTANIVKVLSGDGVTVDFALPIPPSGKNNTNVYIDASYQQKASYSISNNILTFSEAPPIGTDNIEVVLQIPTEGEALPAGAVYTEGGSDVQTELNALGTVATENKQTASDDVTVGRIPAIGNDSTFAHLVSESLSVGYTGVGSKFLVGGSKLITAGDTSVDIAADAGMIARIRMNDEDGTGGSLQYDFDTDVWELRGAGADTTLVSIYADGKMSLPESVGNASSTEVVTGNDTRLTKADTAVQPGASTTLHTVANTYASRAAFVADKDNHTWVAGDTVTAGGVQYEYDGTTTDISDLSGWKPVGAITFEHFGAVGDGATDDADAMQEAIDYAGTLGMAFLTGLAPEYLVDAVRSCDAAGRLGNLLMLDGVHLYGAFKITRGSVANSTRAIIWIEEATSGSMRGFEIDANDAAHGSPTIHGIFKNRTLENYTFEGLTIRNTSAYGIGLQDDDTVEIDATAFTIGETYLIKSLGTTDWNIVAGTSGVTYSTGEVVVAAAVGTGTGTASAPGWTRNCRVVDCNFLDTGNDGVDIKDYHSYTGKNQLTGNYIDGWGANPDLDPNKIGLHIRGDGDTVANNRCINPGVSAGTGIKLDTIKATPFTSEFSVLSNCFVDTTAGTDVDAYTIRRHKVNCNGCTGVVSTSSTGLSVLGGVSDINITSPMLYGDNGSAVGIILASSTDTGITITSGVVRGFPTNYSIRSENTQMIGCRSFESTTYGFYIASGLSNVAINGGLVSVTSGSKVGDLSGNAVISKLQGYKNEAKVTGSFDITSTGVQEVVVAHGMDVTPAVSDCYISLGANDGDLADAWEAAWFKVDDTSATSVYAQIRILTASASGTQDFQVKIDAVK